MFNFLRRNPVKKLEALYRRLLEQARDLQRNGDIEGFAAMTARAQEIGERIEALKERP